MLEAGRLAPTAANRQPFRILVIRTAGRKEELARMYHRPWFSQAPLVLGVCSVPAEAWVRRDGKNYADVDAAIVMDHLVLAAASEGLGTCWVGAFDPAGGQGSPGPAGRGGAGGLHPPGLPGRQAVGEEAQTRRGAAAPRALVLTAPGAACL